MSVRANWRYLREMPGSRFASPAYTVYVNKPAGQFVASTSPSWMTPNMWTGISLLFAGVSIGLLFFGNNVWSGVIAALLLLIGYVFDSADGQLARLRGLSSVRGEWLDHTGDGAIHVLMPIALGFFVWRLESEFATLILVATVVLQLSSSVMYFGSILYSKLKPPTAAGSGGKRAFWLRSVLKLPLDYCMFAVVALCAVLPYGAMTIALTVLAAILFLLLLLHLWYWIRSLPGAEPTRR